MVVSPENRAAVRQKKAVGKKVCWLTRTAVKLAESSHGGLYRPPDEQIAHIRIFTALSNRSWKFKVASR